MVESQTQMVNQAYAGLILVDSDEENILVSLRRNEFEVITPKLE
ncbi:hypothetical protein [Nostoc edaphicum]|nr:hypothetical protein [Nostoc edaphicum]